MNTTNNKQDIIDSIFNKAVECKHYELVEYILSLSTDICLKSLALKILISRDVEFLESMMMITLNCKCKQITSALRNNLLVKNMDVNFLVDEGKHKLIPFFVYIGHTECIDQLLYNYEIEGVDYTEEEKVGMLSKCLEIYNKAFKRQYMFEDKIQYQADANTNEIVLSTLQKKSFNLFKLLCKHCNFSWNDKYSFIQYFCSLNIEESIKNELFDGVFFLDKNNNHLFESSKEKIRTLLNCFKLTPHIRKELKSILGSNDITPSPPSELSQTQLPTNINFTLYNNAMLPFSKLTNPDKINIMKQAIFNGSATMEDLVQLEEFSEGRQFLIEHGILN